MQYINSDVFRPLKGFFSILAIANLSLVFSPVTAAPFSNYDDSEWVINTIDNRLEHSGTNVWTTVAGGHAEQEITIDPTVGVKDASARVDVTGYGTDGLFKIYFAYDEDRYTTLNAPDSHNRMILYTTIPPAGANKQHTFHIGTYSKDPATANQTSNVGNHWYHYYELRGSTGNYWTKMYMDKHPQHEVSSKEPPVNNPTSSSGFDYFDGLTRLYLQMRYSPFQSAWPGPYSMYVDEIEYYTEPRPENEYSINSVAITYFGNGQFDIDWSSFSLYDIHNETYDIKYSFSPINTIDDYTAAELVPENPSGGWGEENLGRTDNHYRATFQIPSMDESKTIYFAIQDRHPDHPKELKRVDYTVGTPPEISQSLPKVPLPPANLAVQ